MTGTQNVLTLPNGAETPTGLPEPPSAPPQRPHDPYRGVVFVLLAAALLGAVGAFAGGRWLSNGVMLEAGVTLLVSAGILIGVAAAQYMRAKPCKNEEEVSSPEPPPVLPQRPLAKLKARLTPVILHIRRLLRELGALGGIRLG